MFLLCTIGGNVGTLEIRQGGVLRAFVGALITALLFRIGTLYVPSSLSRGLLGFNFHQS